MDVRFCGSDVRTERVVAGASHLNVFYSGKWILYYVPYIRIANIIYAGITPMAKLQQLLDLCIPKCTEVIIVTCMYREKQVGMQRRGSATSFEANVSDSVLKAFSIVLATF